MTKFLDFVSALIVGSILAVISFAVVGMIYLSAPVMFDELTFDNGILFIFLVSLAAFAVGFSSTMEKTRDSEKSGKTRPEPQPTSEKDSSSKKESTNKREKELRQDIEELKNELKKERQRSRDKIEDIIENKKQPDTSYGADKERSENKRNSGAGRSDLDSLERMKKELEEIEEND